MHRWWMVRGMYNSCGPAPYEVKQLYVSSDRKGLFKRQHYYALYALILCLHGTIYGCHSWVLTTTLQGASRSWRPRASPPNRPLDTGSDQSHAVPRVRMTFFLTIIIAINVRHRRPHSTSDPDLTLLFVQHRPSLLLYAQQIPAFLASSLPLLVPPFLLLLNHLYRTSNQTLVLALALAHIPCLWDRPLLCLR